MSYKGVCRAAPSSSLHPTWARTIIPLADTQFFISYIHCFKKKYYSLFKLSEYHKIWNNCIKFTLLCKAWNPWHMNIKQGKRNVQDKKKVGTIVDNFSNIQIISTTLSFFSFSKYVVLSFKFEYLIWAVQIRDDWS